MGELKSAFDVSDEDSAPADVVGAREEQAVTVAPRKRGRPPKGQKVPPESREDTKHIGGNFRRQVSTELQRICTEREESTGEKCTIQSLLAEGINHVLRKAGKQPIANEDIRI